MTVVSAESTEKTARLLAVFLLCAVAAGGTGLHFLIGSGHGRRLPQDDYHKAVYVLQQMGGPAAEEQEAVPPGLAYLDAAESLLHHPDKIFALRRLAEDFAAAGPLRPKAPLFEAYARLALGERGRAAALLTRYVAENEYKARHYALLCETLCSLSEHTSLLLICREWAERDPGCLENRAYYLWTALHKLGRYPDAAKSVEGAEGCLGWRAGVYAATSLFAFGQKEKAESLVNRTADRFPERTSQIRRLWEQLRDRERM